MRRNVCITIALLFCAFSAFGGSTPPFTKVPINFPGVPDRQVVLGSDSNLWFLESDANRVGRLTPTGTYTSFSVPTANANLFNIALGPDGNVWFTEDAGKIGKITPDGVIKEFALPSPFFGTPGNITGGPDGNVWFTSQGAVWRVSTANETLTKFPIDLNGGSAALGSGGDGNLWLAGSRFVGPTKSDLILRISPAGVTAAFPMPSLPVGPPSSTDGFDDRLIAGPDGNVWFTYGNNIGRITPAGKITLYPVPTPDSDPWGLAIGYDGNIWFTEYKSGKIGQLIVSTATDSGTATINESEVIDQSPRGIILLPGAWLPEPRAGTLADKDCKKEAFMVHTWVSDSTPDPSKTKVMIITTGGITFCADVAVNLLSGIASLGTLVVVVENKGPDPAQDVRLSLRLSASSLEIASARANPDGNCSSTKESVNCTWSVINKNDGKDVHLNVVVAPNGDLSGLWDASAFSMKTPDPVITNNHRSMRFNSRTGSFEHLNPPPLEVVSTPKRGR